MPLEFIHPDWPAPPHVRACFTLRRGGVSQGPYASLNLGDHVGDATEAVAENRRLLGKMLPSAPFWLKQVHAVRIVDADHALELPEADGSFTRQPGRVSAVLTADCLPVLLCDRSGCAVAAVHAGWRGLAAGVLEAAIAAMQLPGEEILAWLGPAIGPAAFEVGPEVVAAFTACLPQAKRAFIPNGEGRWLADIYELARQRLEHAEILEVYGGHWCTHTEVERFFSYRRDGVTGRMAALIWMDEP